DARDFTRERRQERNSRESGRLFLEAEEKVSTFFHTPPDAPEYEQRRQEANAAMQNHAQMTESPDRWWITVEEKSNALNHAERGTEDYEQKQHDYEEAADQWLSRVAAQPDHHNMDETSGGQGKGKRLYESEETVRTQKKKKPPSKWMNAR